MMQVSILVNSVQNLGDHGREVSTAHEYIPDETVEDMVKRCFGLPKSQWSPHAHTDSITLRVVVENAQDAPRFGVNGKGEEVMF